jgi:N,N-dimethylformamidase
MTTAQLDGAAWMRLTGYSDKWTVEQGDTVNFYVNCDGPAEYRAELIRLADDADQGRGLLETRPADHRREVA